MFYDLIIIGAGPAGLSAAIYGSRAGLKTAIFEKALPGGQITQTQLIENYPGFSTGDGFTLTEIMRKQAESFGAKFISQEVIQINKNKIKTQDNIYTCKSIILAMGASSNKLAVDGELKFTGRGVSYCATCDGAFFRDKIVAVVGGGDAAVEESLFLTKFAKKVYIIHRRDELRATKLIGDRAKANPKIEFVWNSVVNQLKGENKLEIAVLKNTLDNKIKQLNIDGIFIYVGISANTKLVANLVKLDEKNFVITNRDQKTNIESIFASGDICKKELRQVVTATSDGAIAAFMAEKEISKN